LQPNLDQVSWVAGSTCRVIPGFFFPYFFFNLVWFQSQINWVSKLWFKVYFYNFVWYFLDEKENFSFSFSIIVQLPLVNNNVHQLGLSIFGSVRFWTKINNQTVFFLVFEPNQTKNRFKPINFSSVRFVSLPNRFKPNCNVKMPSYKNQQRCSRCYNLQRKK